MELGPFYVGQKPGYALVLTLRDPHTNEVKNLTNFTSASLRMVDPSGASVDTSGGTMSISDANGGKVTYIWPTDASLFSRAGDYKIQVVLTGTTSQEFTSTTVFEVYKPLGS